MCIDDLVKENVISAISKCDYDPDAIGRGVAAYAYDNGFYELEARFSENVIRRVIKNNLSPVLDMQPDSVALFFENYHLIKRVRMINNQSLALADAVRTGHKTSPDELSRIETEFDDCMAEVCSVQGLREFLNVQISEIILNIDYAKGESSNLSQRLNSIEGKNR